MRKFRVLVVLGLLAFAKFEHIEADCCDYLCDSWLPCWSFCTYPITTDVNLSYNYFRGLPNTHAKRNSGGLLSVNSGFPILKRTFDPGFAGQIGVSYGIYDFSGRRKVKDEDEEEDAPRSKNKKTERQLFVTGGWARKTPYYCGFNLGMVVDVMRAQNFTQFEFDPTIAQVRYQGGYLWARKDELGFWGTVYANTALTKTEFDRIRIHAVDQFNVFWSHYFAQCTKFSIWIGVPLTGSKNKFIAGGYIRLPINECFSIEGNVGYMTSNRKGCDDDEGKSGHRKGHSYLNVCFGITYLLGCTKEYHCHEFDYCPYMMLGGNSNFFIQSHVR